MTVTFFVIIFYFLFFQIYRLHFSVVHGFSPYCEEDGEEGEEEDRVFL